MQLAANVTLIFQGGKFAANEGAVLIGNNTVIMAPCIQIFSKVSLRGSFIVDNWNACWFGCKGDGQTNNSVALKYALDTLYNLVQYNSMNAGKPSVSGIYEWQLDHYSLFIPNGRFKLESTIEIPRVFSMHGTGDGSEIIVSHSGYGFHCSSNSQPYDNNDMYIVSLRDLAFSGTSTTSGCGFFHNDLSDGGNGGNDGLYSTRFRMSRCKLYNFTKAMYLNDAWWVRLSDCDFYDNGQTDIVLYRPNSTSIMNCGFRGEPQTHLLLAGPSGGGVNIMGNDFSGATVASIKTVGFICDTMICGNYFEPQQGRKSIQLGPDSPGENMSAFPRIVSGSHSCDNVTIKGNQAGYRCYIEIGCILVDCEVHGDIYYNPNYQFDAGPVYGNVGLVRLLADDTVSQLASSPGTAVYYDDSRLNAIRTKAQGTFEIMIEKHLYNVGAGMASYRTLFVNDA